jgi:hypothetical protein
VYYLTIAFFVKQKPKASIPFIWMAKNQPSGGRMLKDEARKKCATAMPLPTAIGRPA